MRLIEVDSHKPRGEPTRAGTNEEPDGEAMVTLVALKDASILAETSGVPVGRFRIESVDILRGAVMILMALIIPVIFLVRLASALPTCRGPQPRYSSRAG